MKSARSMYLGLTLTCLGILGAGCDGSPTSPTSVPSPSPPPTTAPSSSQASLAVQVSNVEVAEMAGGGAVLTFDLGVIESAGVGAHMNFVRLDMYAATGEFIERQEIGASQISAALGSNYVRGGGAVLARVTFPFRSTIKVGRTFDVVVDFTDDRGNHLVSRTSFVWTKG